MKKDLKIIISAAKLLCLSILKKFEHETPDEVFDTASLLLEAINNFEKKGKK
jgi:hypothetical protein